MPTYPIPAAYRWDVLSLLFVRSNRHTPTHDCATKKVLIRLCDGIIDERVCHRRRDDGHHHPAKISRGRERS